MTTIDRKSTRLNSSHMSISYAVFCLKKKKGYVQLWLKRGIMAAIMSWLETDELAIRLRKTTDGERRLTNLMHLGDLLQQRSRKLRGHEALLRWFTEHVLGDDEAGEESQLFL